MEADGVDTNRAARRSVLTRPESHALSTATLGVLDHGALCRARVSLLASGTIRHAVGAFNVCILGGGDLHLINRHGFLTGARHRWLLVQVAGDALALKATLGQSITLPKRVRTAEAREVIVAIRGEGARSETTPVVSALLSFTALVVGVFWARVGWLIIPAPAKGDHLVSCETGDEDRRGLVLHDDERCAV